MNDGAADAISPKDNEILIAIHATTVSTSVCYVATFTSEGRAVRGMRPSIPAASSLDGRPLFMCTDRLNLLDVVFDAA